MQKNGLYSRRDYRKLHIVTAKNGIIVSYKITHGQRHDAPVFEQICKKLPCGSGYVILDAAYLLHKICMLIESTGRTLVIMPDRVRGFDVMDRMLRRYRDDHYVHILQARQRRFIHEKTTLCNIELTYVCNTENKTRTLCFVP